MNLSGHLQRPPWIRVAFDAVRKYLVSQRMDFRQRYESSHTLFCGSKTKFRSPLSLFAVSSGPIDTSPTRASPSLRESAVVGIAGGRYKVDMVSVTRRYGVRWRERDE